jgi:hypothetical protein
MRFFDLRNNFHWFVRFIETFDRLGVFEWRVTLEIFDIVKVALQVKRVGIFFEKSDSREFGCLSILRVIDFVVFLDDFFFLLNIIKADNLEHFSLVLGNGVNEVVDIGLRDVEEDEYDLSDFAGDPETVPEVERKIDDHIQ